MVFERNLNGIEVILRIDNYESPSKHTFGDWWCDWLFISDGKAGRNHQLS